ncbi:hypothetical protein Phi4:1_gp104 [Cellulophaga phage phi4:1]|uniref:Uncharacterized protein n=3 Tax=Lightbulbvirus Cba41 TaxID=1918524 RepID=A0A0S2MWL7_9CAUD|nr:hypothetical protein Phi4:1_gp104 [Cellulophaga phage phi4:1]AGO49517.1 hypothetical protein Phi4:1_gp104 [Cellulophaga phage phi4:1]ALO80113.1 hypothetical protein Phi4113_104 [Cellulophaga phage phi4:1_13]ALO80310.1 hypothetical protein Phi4118_104 [Cellulophaga phage phi4:1_18]
MNQNDTPYHELFLSIKGADDYWPVEEREEVLSLVKKLHDREQDRLAEEDEEGKYGLRYKTIHDDSRFSDTHEQFFSSKSKREKVFLDWKKGVTWDSIFETELEYPTPGGNFHGMVKIFKEGTKTYEE